MFLGVNLLSRENRPRTRLLPPGRNSLHGGTVITCKKMEQRRIDRRLVAVSCLSYGLSLLMARTNLNRGKDLD